MGQIFGNLLAMAGLGIGMYVYSFLRRANMDRRVLPGGDSEISATNDEHDGMMKFSCSCSFNYQKHRSKRHCDCKDRVRFLKEVEKSLKLKIDSGSKLKGFFMRCCFLEDCVSHLEHWMQTIARLDVEEFILGNPSGIKLDTFSFSFQLISGVSTLRKLQLFGCRIDPCFIGQYNSLAYLSLDYIPLLRDELLAILLVCPNLQHLSLCGCRFLWRLRIFGPDLKLKHLKLIDCNGLHELDISAGNLVTIKMSTPRNVELLLSSVPKLEYLSLVIAGMPFCFGDVPRDLPHLKFLSIQATTQAMDEIPGIPPSFEMFGNIRILCLLIKQSCHQGARQQVDLWNFTPVLSACPLLEVFALMVEGPPHEVERKVQWPVLQHKHL